VVDDNKVNRMMLARMLTDQGHRVTQVEDGIQALNYLENPDNERVDVILLDILMPGLDGYQVLEKIKHNPELHYLPVIMISALDELDSVVRCIQIGATDYLTKPIQADLLKARLKASLAEKRLRDLEREYLEQVGYVVDAANAIEASTYDPDSLRSVATREDALGNLARVFQRMAREVHLREQRLRQQLEQLRLDMQEMKRALQEPLSVYLPMDRRHALVEGKALPDRASGSALFADISCFTPLTESFYRELGRTRGAEEMTRLINQVFDALVEEIHLFRGSVINFSGDAITCWFDQDDGLRAAACAIFLQLAMLRFETLITPLESSLSLSIKVAVVSGSVRRFLLGDPGIQNIEAIAGHKLDILAAAEQIAQEGDVIVEGAIAKRYAKKMEIKEWRTSPETGESFAVVSRLVEPVLATPWPALAADALSQEVCRPWLHPEIYERVRSSAKQFLAELRPAAVLFLHFGGVDYDHDEGAGSKLDNFICWVQQVATQHEGMIIQFTLGDKGSYVYVAFGAPLAHPDDAARAVRAAFTLHSPPPELSYITGIQIGITYGQMRSGAYGSSTQRTYGVMGNRVNLAARLMQAANGRILCDDAIYQAAQAQFHFEILPPIHLKGREEPFPIYQPTKEKIAPVKSLAELAGQVDRLSPAEQMALKMASVIGSTFDVRLLKEIFPAGEEKQHLPAILSALANAGLLTQDSIEGIYQFQHAELRETVYDSMLFVQRRQLHRQIAEWMEGQYRDDLCPYFEIIGRHWQQAEEPTKAVEYLERAGRYALSLGDREKAEELFRESLELDASAAVLSAEYYGKGVT
jgi:CheY-like chemotaxis protein/class 3 adenylate cyclase